MKKEYLYLIIAGVVIYIISQNRKDEENGQTEGGYIPAIARITPIQFPDIPNTTETIRQIDNDKDSQGAKVKAPKAGEGLVS